MEGLLVSKVKPNPSPVAWVFPLNYLSEPALTSSPTATALEWVPSTLGFTAMALNGGSSSGLPVCPPKSVLLCMLYSFKNCYAATLIQAMWHWWRINREINGRDQGAQSGPTHNVQQKVQGNSMEKGKPLPTNESGNIGHPHGEWGGGGKGDPYLTPYTN